MDNIFFGEKGKLIIFGFFFFYFNFEINYCLKNIYDD